MNIQTTQRPTTIAASLFILTIAFTACNAQEFTRKGQTEICGVFQTMSSETLTSSNVFGWPITADLDSTMLFGVGIGHNITDHWNINTDILYGKQDWTVNQFGFWPVTNDFTLYLFDVNVDYNIFKGPLTPLVTGGIGVMNIRGNGANETDFSYNVGAGARWDISEQFLLKIIYRIMWTDIEDADNTAQFGGINVNFGFKF